MLPGAPDQKAELSEMDETLGASPPLELRRITPGGGLPQQRTTVPHSLQSPQDRATGKIHFFSILFRVDTSQV